MKLNTSVIKIIIKFKNINTGVFFFVLPFFYFLLQHILFGGYKDATVRLFVLIKTTLKHDCIKSNYRKF